ncbi:MAG: response regulator [Candidatus Brocadiia bacterium]
MAKLLLVEDEENLSLLYQVELGAEGHEVVVAQDGKTAIELARSESPDLVIMDINLPEKMDGIESMSRILSEDKSIPVIINTGYSQYKENFMTWAAEAYVVKSGDLDPLKKAIKNVLEGSDDERDQNAGRPPVFGDGESAGGMEDR